MAQGRPSSKEEAGSQRGAKAGGEDEVYKGHLCGTTQDGLARPLVNVRD